MRNVEQLIEPLNIGNGDNVTAFKIDGRSFHSKGYVDDLKIELTQGKQGQNLLPAYDFVNKGLLFPQNDITQRAHASEEFSHTRLIGSDIEPHIHFIQTSATVPIFKMLFRWYGQGHAVPAYTEYTTDALGVFPFIGSPMLQMTKFPTIPSISNGLSSHIDVEIWRQGDSQAGDVLGKFFDIHFYKDSHGSTTAANK